MLHWLTHLVAGSAWAYPAIVALVAMDGLVPMVPGEGAVLTASILAADGELSFALVVLSAFAGALAGDNGSYWLGRALGQRAVGRFVRGDRARARLEWAQALLRSRGASLIVVARFVPGGRTATTLAAGTLGMAWRKFVAADALACGLWAVYVGALGYLGGHAFERSLWKPLLMAAAGGALITVAAELYRRLRLSRSGEPQAADRAHPAQSG